MCKTSAAVNADRIPDAGALAELATQVLGVLCRPTLFPREGNQFNGELGAGSRSLTTVLVQGQSDFALHTEKCIPHCSS